MDGHRSSISAPNLAFNIVWQHMLVVIGTLEHGHVKADGQVVLAPSMLTLTSEMGKCY